MPLIVAPGLGSSGVGARAARPDLAEAILDRVLERGRHIELRGRFYRTRDAPLGLPAR